MDVTVDPHGRLPLPTPLRERLTGQRVDLTWDERADGTVAITLAKPAGLTGPSTPDGVVAPAALAAALQDTRTTQGVTTLDPGDHLPGAAGVMAARRGGLRATRTFVSEFEALTDTGQARAVVDVAHAVAAEPLHPSLDLTATDYPNVWTVTAGAVMLAFTRDQGRTPIWLTITPR